MPAIALSATTGAASSVALPRLTAIATGHDSTGEQAAAITLPALTASATAGSNASATLSGLTVHAAGTVTALAEATLALPSLLAAASGKAASTARAALSFPGFNVQSFAGALCRVTIAGVTAQAAGTTGGVGGAQLTLPLFQATAIATAGNHGSANIVLPSFTVHSGGNGAAASLPSLQLTAIGSAVVTATYEAYAVNLLQPLDQSPSNNYDAKVNAVTHYTNFPFTHVVRYKNSYYGANSTGLYLLEGTTDGGAPIAYAVKTCETDFDKPELKTVESAYFAGRIGSAETVTLYAREDTTNAQSFTTPRTTAPQSHRQAFGRGIKARYFAVGLSGNKEFALDTVDLSVGNTKRRI